MKFKKSVFMQTGRGTVHAWRAVNDRGVPLWHAPTILEHLGDTFHAPGFVVGAGGGDWFETLSQAKSEVKRQIRMGGFING
ncbi:hypothetical protein D3C78_1227690 [compost metagenome]